LRTISNIVALCREAHRITFLIAGRLQVRYNAVLMLISSQGVFQEWSLEIYTDTQYLSAVL
jgi:hypothetical protein